MIDMRWHFCRWPKAGRYQQGGRQMACVLAPTRPPPSQAGLAQLLLGKGAVWTTRKTARERGRKDRKIEALPFPHPQKHRPASQHTAEPKGTSLEGGLCASMLSGAAWNSKGQSQKHGHVCGLTRYDFVFCFLPRLFYECVCKTGKVKTQLPARMKSISPNAWDTCDKSGHQSTHLPFLRCSLEVGQATGTYKWRKHTFWIKILEILCWRLCIREKCMQEFYDIV